MFKKEASRLTEILILRTNIDGKGWMFDIEVMIEMGHSPPSWKAWQPKLIEWLRMNTFRATNPFSDKPSLYEFGYDKKSSKWTCVEVFDTFQNPN